MTKIILFFHYVFTMTNVNANRPLIYDTLSYDCSYFFPFFGPFYGGTLIGDFKKIKIKINKKKKLIFSRNPLINLHSL